MLCFVSIDNHVIELSKVTHMVAGEGDAVVVHMTGGAVLELGGNEADMFFVGMEGLARKGAIVCVDARRSAPKPAPPAPPPPVQLDLIPTAAQSARKRPRATPPQKASA